LRKRQDCRVASLLAMTIRFHDVIASPALRDAAISLSGYDFPQQASQKTCTYSWFL